MFELTGFSLLALFIVFLVLRFIIKLHLKMIKIAVYAVFLLILGGGYLHYTGQMPESLQEIFKLI